MRSAALRLGELLEQRGQITHEQLLRALRNQKVVGGRLGTCLLEIEAVTEEQLCSALAHQLGVPSASPEDLRGIPEDVLEMLPAKVARRCHAIAFQASTTQVKVALIDARDLTAQDEIAFVVGKRIRWHVAPEIRLMEALEKHHGEECPARLAKLLDKMNRSRFLWAREAATALPPEGAAKRAGDQLQWDSRIAGVAPESSAAGTLETASTVSGELPQFQHQALELPIVPSVSSATPAPTAAAGGAPRPAAPPTPLPTSPPAAASTAPPEPPAPPPLPPPRPPPPPPTTPAVPPAKPMPPPAPSAPHRRGSVEETEKRLLQTRERDDVARAVLDFAAGVAPRVVLFVVRKDAVSAWLWSGAGIEGDRLAALRLRLNQPSLFAGLREAGAYFRGPLSPLPAHLELAACFAAPAVTGDLLVLPVKVKDRLVAALLLEPRPASGEDLTAGDLADLQRVLAKAEIAFELCIMQSKLRKA